MGKILSEKIVRGTGLISEKTEALYTELKQNSGNSHQNFSAVNLLINHDNICKA